MASEDLVAHVIDEITRLLPEVEGDVRPDSQLESDLGMDSIHLIDLVTNIERSLGIDIPDSDTEDLKSVSDIVDAISQHSRVA
ncbi:acyl carrier protein [Nocardiopsis oceani]